MSKKLPSCTFVDGYHCLTVTTYKGYEIYKLYTRGLEMYKILINGKLCGCCWYLRDAKKEIDEKKLYFFNDEKKGE